MVLLSEKRTKSKRTDFYAAFHYRQWWHEDKRERETTTEPYSSSNSQVRPEEAVGTLLRTQRANLD